MVFGRRSCLTGFLNLGHAEPQCLRHRTVALPMITNLGPIIAASSISVRGQASLDCRVAG